MLSDLEKYINDNCKYNAWEMTQSVSLIIPENENFNSSVLTFISNQLKKNCVTFVSNTF